ncbi:MAG: hypothetical protein Kow009_08080 [Spirochaetales bacterium]
MPFHPAYDPSKNFTNPPADLLEGYWFLFEKNNLLLPLGSTTVPRYSLPRALRATQPRTFSEDLGATAEAPGVTAEADPSPTDLSWILPRIGRIYYFGTLDGIPCRAAYLSHGKSSSPSALPPGWEAMNLRMAYGRLSPEALQAARFASHLLFWDRNTRFCGVCGAPTTDKPDERAKICTDPLCRSVFYPKISPAVIVAILDDDRILLAHNRKFVSKFYSLIAGFVEIGESLEDCVHREVREEVGVEVTNIRYFGSQPWPTPDSLMIGFLVDYAGGDIRIQADELHDARWFSPPDIPALPPSDSIARRILRWYETEYVPRIRREPQE